MSAQLDLFAAARQPPIRLPVDPSGEVIRGDCDESHVLPHPRLAWHLAQIDLHQHTDGLWMWGINDEHGGYRVGPKWGRFAATREDALHCAIDELLSRRPIENISKWAEGLRPKGDLI